MPVTQPCHSSYRHSAEMRMLVDQKTHPVMFKTAIFVLLKLESSQIPVSIRMNSERFVRTNVLERAVRVKTAVRHVGLVAFQNQFERSQTTPCVCTV